MHLSDWLGNLRWSLSGRRLLRRRLFQRAARRKNAAPPSVVPCLVEGLEQRVLLTPSITALDVHSGPTAGSTTVHISGTGFTGVSAVMFGNGVMASSYTVNSTTSITAVSPTHAVLVHRLLRRKTSRNRQDGKMRLEGCLMHCQAARLFGL